MGVAQLLVTRIVTRHYLSDSRALPGDVFGLFCFYFNALRAENKLHLYHERTVYEAEEEHPGQGNVFSTERSTSTWCVHGNTGKGQLFIPGTHNSGGVSKQGEWKGQSDMKKGRDNWACTIQ